MFNIAPQKVLHLYKEEEKKQPNIAHNYMGTFKIDGWYTFVDHKVGQGFSNIRNENREIPSMLWLHKGLKYHLPENMDYRIIMEAYIPDTSFHILNGIFNRKNEDAKDVRFAIHDIIPINKPTSALERYNLINGYFEEYKSEGADKELFTILPLLGVSDNKSDWLDWYDNAISLGEEGIILKQTDSFYQPDKRNSSLMKIKCEEEADLLATNYYNSYGEKGNPAWNLELVDKAGTIVNVRVGKDSDITKFASDNPIGKVHQIKYMKKLDNGSYREPVYVGPRYDKKVSEID